VPADATALEAVVAGNGRDPGWPAGRSGWSWR